MNELTTLIQQAIDNGDTATARALSRALENQTKVSTIAYQEPAQVFNQPQYIEPQQTYYYAPSRSQNGGVSISWWLCFVILPYLAVAEVLAPGHQGPLKIHQTKLAWPVEMVGTVFGNKDATTAEN
jgi:hypothetical protein